MLNKKLAGKKILLGVTGGIAAYKTPELVRLLKKSGAEVKVILSKGALEFVTTTSLESVSANPVAMECSQPGNPMLHIDLARWADIYLIAPLTANRLAALTHGFADDLVSTVYLATTAPVWIAPAMNKQMWEHPATQSNIHKISKLTNIMGPAVGEQACLEVGPGRMLEPEDIVCNLNHADTDPILEGKSIMITAGPTRESLDPIRYLTNRSSGKMGYHLAEQAHRMGAKVTLVSGPVELDAPKGVKLMQVETAQQMYEAVLENILGVDIFIGAAAVADYRPKTTAQKIKKQPGHKFEIEWVQNPDILASVAAQPQRPFCVGFAAETHNPQIFAQQKLQQKQLDMIALNPIGEPGVGFECDTNALEIFWDGNHHALPLTSKAQIADQLLQLIHKRYHEKENSLKNFR